MTGKDLIKLIEQAGSDKPVVIECEEVFDIKAVETLKDFQTQKEHIVLWAGEREG